MAASSSAGNGNGYPKRTRRSEPTIIQVKEEVIEMASNNGPFQSPYEQLIQHEAVPPPAVVPPKKPKEQKCRWDRCTHTGDINGSLFEHLLEHVNAQKSSKKEQMCLWVGCRVYKVASRSVNYLEKHIHKHTNEKPFRCVFDTCAEQFTTQFALERHVQTHLRQQDASMLFDTSGETSMIGTADFDVLNGDESHRSFLRGGIVNGTYQNMLLQQVQHQSNEKKVNRKRRAKINGVPVAYAANRDCFTESEIFHLTRLFDMCPYFSTDKSGTVVVLQPKITMKRLIGDRTEQYVEWTPEDIYPGEWINGSDAKLKAKHVPISELTAFQLNCLLPPIYAYRPRIRGQRKRSVISTLQSK
ncbi:unnamed protein product [Rotaria socialis]|uniref:C2H2-type domain-containing protein n=1 Tax=Rotaria socialis TaxID=392032 RepID=A0A817K891_9BILA|nr:unnamed protein product [Rotaria socialis]CAF3440685.1 unnamed protein product [Rotaria socialis]CAF4478738.1 unnamed protein product [Rotaria socialis]